MTGLTRVCLPLLLWFPVYGQLSTRLSSQTDSAFDSYVTSAEAKMDWRAHLQPAPGGAVVTSPIGPNGPAEVKDGLIHDWLAAATVPGATVEKALAVLQGYDDYKTKYLPSVIDSKVLGHEGNQWRVFLRLYRKKVFTAILDTEYNIEYRPQDQGRWIMLSRSAKIAEVEKGKELAPGVGHGFLWRLNAYWTLEPRPEGVYLECRAISLSRDVPAGLGWVINPMLTSLPRDSLRETLEATIRALR